MRALPCGCWILGMGLLVGLVACNGNSASNGPSDSLGGSTPTGGTFNLGGNSTTASLTNGGSNIGGTNSSGGATNRGGTNTGNGGTTATTGGTATSAGGTTATVGGTTYAGGVSNAGGSAPKGGSNTGGNSSSSVGGAQPAGGTTSSSSSSGGASGNVTMGGNATGGQNSSSGGTTIGGQVTTPASSTANFPFPQNRRDTKCTYPSSADYGDVQKVYDQWKQHLVTSDGVGANCSPCRRVKRPAEAGLQKDSTVSEGIAYGMIIAVYMNDQALFDDLWRYAQAHTATVQSTGFPATSTPTILMNWYIAADGTTATTANGGQSGAGAATDADEDMAWALVMADKQWKGGKGSLSDTYANNAKKLLGDIWKYEIFNNQTPKNGSGWGSNDCLNISYFAPSHYRTFASISGESRWASAVVPQVYAVIAASLNSANGNQTNGLVPAFSTSTGGNDKCGTAGASNQKHWYQYDSCRTPFRIGIDACLNDSAEAANYVGKTSSFFVPKGAAGIVDGYELNGTDKPEFPGGTYKGLSAAFIGPAGVGAMYPQSGKNYQSFVDEVYDRLRQNNMWTGGQYYDESWTMLSLLMMTGNYLDYTKY